MTSRGREKLAVWQVEPPLPGNAEEDDFDNLATALLDTKLLEAVQLINMDLKQETRQVILLGCGLDTRPHRYAYKPPCMRLTCPAAFTKHAFAGDFGSVRIMRLCSVSHYSFTAA